MNWEQKKRGPQIASFISPLMGIIWSDVVAGKCEPSSHNLANTEPCIQLNPEKSCNTSILDLQLLPVLPDLLQTIQLFPKCLLPTRNAARHTKSSAHICGLIISNEFHIKDKRDRQRYQQLKMDTSHLINIPRDCPQVYWHFPRTGGSCVFS